MSFMSTGRPRDPDIVTLWCRLQTYRRDQCQVAHLRSDTHHTSQWPLAFHARAFRLRGSSSVAASAFFPGLSMRLDERETGCWHSGHATCRGTGPRAESTTRGSSDLNRHSKWNGMLHPPQSAFSEEKNDEQSQFFIKK